MNNRSLIALLYYGVTLLLATPSCSSIDSSHGSLDFSPVRSVKASEAIAIARAYASHHWHPSPKNQFHGTDADGIQVNTPDVSLPDGIAKRPGWWRPGQTNIGIPYKWGGFDTPTEFSQRVKDGAYAGDVYTSAKRRSLYRGVSTHAAGVDCSGLISRCWRLDRHYSTRALPELCDPLPSFSDLQPGDILNKHNVHVMLFIGFTDQSQQYFTAYQTGAPPSWKVQKYTLSTAEVRSWGFLPHRYKNIIQD